MEEDDVCVTWVEKSSESDTLNVGVRRSINSV